MIGMLAAAATLGLAVFLGVLSALRTLPEWRAQRRHGLVLILFTFIVGASLLIYMMIGAPRIVGML